jgi:hypothetical protein
MDGWMVGWVDIALHKGSLYDPQVKDIPTPKEWKSSYSGSFGLETRNSVEIRTETIVVVVEMRLRFPSPF